MKCLSIDLAIIGDKRIGIICLGPYLIENKNILPLFYTNRLTNKVAML